MKYLIAAGVIIILIAGLVIWSAVDDLKKGSEQ
jgi:hypothetical protein